MSVNGEYADINGGLAIINAKPPLKEILAASDNYPKGWHEGNPGGLSTIDTDLAVGNIKDGVTIFGKLGTLVEGVDISDADALLTDVKAGKTFYSVAAPRKTGSLPTKAIVAGAETYEEGYHAGNGGGLSAIDADLAVANIKKDTDIFGKVGTYDPTPTVTHHHTTSSLYVSGLGATYTEEVATADIPAAAKKVIISYYYEEGSTVEWATCQVLYNGVQRLYRSGGSAANAYLQWTGDGVGSPANVTVECKKYNSDDSTTISLNVFYVT